MGLVNHFVIEEKDEGKMPAVLTLDVQMSSTDSIWIGKANWVSSPQKHPPVNQKKYPFCFQATPVNLIIFILGINEFLKISTLNYLIVAVL